MFQFDVDLFVNAKKKNESALSSLNNRKRIAQDIMSMTLKNKYDKNDTLMRVCQDILDVELVIKDLNSNIENTRKTMGINLDDGVSIGATTFSSNVLGSNMYSAVDNVSNIDNFEDIINQIQESNEFTEEEKASILFCYQNENFDGILLLLDLHRLMQNLTNVENEIAEIKRQIAILDPMGTESHTTGELRELESKLKQLENQKFELSQEIYNKKKDYELTKYNHVYNKVKQEGYVGYTDIENIKAFFNGSIPDSINGAIINELRFQNGTLNEFALYDYIFSGEGYQGLSKKECLDLNGFLSSNSLIWRAYSYMTDEERLVYDEIFNTDGEEKANEYLKALEDDLNFRYGYDLASEDIEKICARNSSLGRCIQSYGEAILPGAVSWYENSTAFITADDTKTVNDYRIEAMQRILTGSYQLVQEISSEDVENYSEKANLTEEQYQEFKKQYQELKKNGSVSLLDIYHNMGVIDDVQFESYKNLGNQVSSELESKGLGLAYGVGISTGNMLPSIAVSALFSGAGAATAGKAAANIMMFTSSAGGSLKTSMQKGLSLSDSYKYATVMGASEVATGYFLGKIPFISKMDDYAKLSKKFWINMSWNALQEGGEEAFQTVFSATIDSVMLGEPIVLEELTTETIYSALAGVLSSANLQTTSVTFQTASGVASFTMEELGSCLKEDGSIDINKFKSDIVTKAKEVVTIKKTENISTKDAMAVITGALNNTLSNLGSTFNLESGVKSNKINLSELLKYNPEKAKFALEKINQNFKSEGLPTISITNNGEIMINNATYGHKSMNLVTVNPGTDLNAMASKKTLTDFSQFTDKLNEVLPENWQSYIKNGEILELGKYLLGIETDKNILNGSLNVMPETITTDPGKKAILYESVGKELKELSSWFEVNAEKISNRIKVRQSEVSSIDIQSKVLQSSQQNVNTNPSSTETLLTNAIATMDLKYGIGEGIKALKTIAETGNFNIMTRDNGARASVVSIGTDGIKNFLGNLDTMVQEINVNAEKNVDLTGENPLSTKGVDAPIIEEISSLSELTENKEIGEKLNSETTNPNITIKLDEDLKAILQEEIPNYREVLTDENLQKINNLYIAFDKSYESLEYHEARINEIRNDSNYRSTNPYYQSLLDSEQRAYDIELENLDNYRNRIRAELAVLQQMAADKVVTSVSNSQETIKPIEIFDETLESPNQESVEVIDSGIELNTRTELEQSDEILDTNMETSESRVKLNSEESFDNEIETNQEPEDVLVEEKMTEIENSSNLVSEVILDTPSKEISENISTTNSNITIKLDEDLKATLQEEIPNYREVLTDENLQKINNLYTAFDKSYESLEYHEARINEIRNDSNYRSTDPYYQSLLDSEQRAYDIELENLDNYRNRIRSELVLLQQMVADKVNTFVSNSQDTIKPIETLDISIDTSSSQIEVLDTETEVVSNNTEMSDSSIRRIENQAITNQIEATKISTLNSHSELLTQYHNLSEIEKKQFWNDCTVDQLLSLSSILKTETDFVAEINQKIIEYQDQILSSEFSGTLFEYIGQHSEVLSHINSSLLTSIYSFTEKGFESPLIMARHRTEYTLIRSNLLNELTTRIDNGNLIFDVLVNPLFTKNAFQHLSVDLKTKIDKLLSGRLSNIPQEITDLHLSKFSQAFVMRLYEEDKLDSNSLKILNQLALKNPDIVKSFNFEVLNPEMIQLFGEDYLSIIGRYSELSTKLVSLFNTNKELVISLASIYKKHDNSLFTRDIINKACLDFFFANETILKNFNQETLTSSEFVNYILYQTYSHEHNGNSSGKITIDFSNNYQQEFALQCDQNFNKGVSEGNLNHAKDAFFQKYFSITYQEAIDILEKYYQHIYELSQYEEGVKSKDFLDAMMHVVEIDDIGQLQYAYQLMDDSEITFTAEEMLYRDKSLKELYATTYVENLQKTDEMLKNNQFNTVLYNGKPVKVIDLDSDFSMLVYSSDSGFVENKTLVNNSYISSWYNVKPKTIGLSTSYITSENLGSAPVIGVGVLYGFTNITENQVNAMAPYDVNSNLALYTLGTENKQSYISAEHMSENTTRVYNEIVLDRSTIKPNYIILYTDASNQIVENSYKAAAEWEIPIVKIDKTEVAQTQMEKINTLVSDFKNNRNLASLEKALSLYESNISGYKLNSTTTQKGKIDYSASINNEFVRNIFDPTNLIQEVNLYIEKIKTDGDITSINSLLGILENIKSRYDIANQNGTHLITTTESALNYKVWIEILKK